MRRKLIRFLPFALALTLTGAALASSSAKFVGAGSNDASAGNRQWTNTSNIVADDGVSAILASSTMGEEDATQYLVATMAGNLFAVPADATIDGVEVTIKRRNALAGSGTLRDEEVSLTVGGSIRGDNKAATGTLWGSSFAAVTYGGPADTWGLALSPEDVNITDFGVALRAYCEVGSVEPRVDYISVTIYYSGAAGASSATTMLMGSGR